MGILRPREARYVGDVQVAIVGGGGCGLTAAISAREADTGVIVLERDRSALGSTAMSTGLIPGAGTRWQAQSGIKDSQELFFDDVMKKTYGKIDVAFTKHLIEQAPVTLEWLAEAHGVPLSLVDSFDFPGHSRRRMHGLPQRSGAELMGALHNVARQLNVDVMTDAPVTDLFADEAGHIGGLRITRSDGTTEDIKAASVILACCGFAGNPELVHKYIPEISIATVYGHPGNKGDALSWGQALGANVADLDSYQGHGSVAPSHGVSIMWAHIMEGGIQVNLNGERFSNESKGYSEQAMHVVGQPGHTAWSIYDETIHMRLMEYADYNEANKTGCILRAESIAELRQMTGLPGIVETTLRNLAECVDGESKDAFGRNFNSIHKLEPPYRMVKVTGALFHTQGGLVVNNDGRVKRSNGDLFSNLFAGGGAARGISGPGSGGYLSGNGLLTATTIGRLAGRAAARLSRGDKV